MSDPDTQQRLNAIEDRLRRLEAAVRLLGVDRLAGEQPRDTAPTQPAQPAPAAPAEPDRKRELVRDLARPPAPPMSPPPEAPRPTPARPARPPVSLEQLIGGKSFLILGALIVVAGVGFFLKLAIDQGWIARIPPVWRCVATAAFGFVLIGVGEATARRLGRFAAAGFKAAGIAVLYATAYAAFAFFGLVGAVAGFWMLLGVCAIGQGVALHGRSVWLAALALVGGYLTPLIVRPDQSPSWSLPLYLTALIAVGSILATRVPRYRVLASLTWWGTLALGSVWVLLRADEDGPVTLAFVAAVWGVVHWTRSHLARDARSRWAAWPGVASFSTTCWSVGSGLWAADATGVVPLWIVTGAALVFTLGLAWRLGRGVELLRTPPTTDRAVLGVSLAAQAGALAPTTLLLAVDRPWAHSAVLLAFGVAAFAASRRIRAQALSWYGAAILTLAYGRLGVTALVGHDLYTDGRAAVGLVFTPWMGLVLALGASWLVSAWIAHRTAGDLRSTAVRTLAAIAFSAGVLTLAVAFLHERAEARGLLLAWSVLGIGAFAAALAARRAILDAAGAVYTALAAAAWAGAHLTPGWDDTGGGAPALLHPGLWWSLLLAAMLAWSVRVARMLPEFDRILAVRTAWISAGALLLTATTLEVARIAGMLTQDATAQAGAVSVWWAAVSAALLAFGFARSRPSVRYAGLGLMLVAVGKALTYDIAQLSPAVRVACFIVLGLVLLGVAAAYLKVAKSQRERPESGGETAFRRAD